MNANKKPLVCVITGGTGLIGRCVLEQLQSQFKDAIFHVLLKEASSSSFSSNSSSIFYHYIDFRVHDVYSLELDRVDIVIHLAVHWGGWADAKQVNIVQTKRLFEWANQKGASRFIYCSTASILNEAGKVMEEAARCGTSYIRSKYEAYHKLNQLSFSDSIFFVFPTLTVDLDRQLPLLHKQFKPLISVLSFFSIQGQFHWIHAKDVALCILGLIQYKGKKRHFVLANQAVQVNDFIKFCAQKFQCLKTLKIPLPSKLISAFLRIVSRRSSAWDHYCIKRGNFVFPDVVDPSFFNFPIHYPSLSSLLDRL